MSSSLRPHGLFSPWNSPGQNTGVGSLSVLQGIFPTQGLNPGLLHCRQILYQLSYEGSPPISITSPVSTQAQKSLFKEHGAKSSERVRFSLTTCPDAQSDDGSQPAVGASCSRLLPLQGTGGAFSIDSEEYEAMPVEVKLLPRKLQFFCDPRRREQLLQRPAEWAGGRWAPETALLPPRDQKETEASAVPTVWSEDPKGRFTAGSTPPPFLSVLPSFAASFPAAHARLRCDDGPVHPEDRFS